MIIDIHIHRGPSPDQFVDDLSLPRLLETMDTLGIQISISSNSLSLNYNDFEGGAKLACEEFDKSEGRVRSYFYYHPKIVDESLRVMNVYRNQRAFCGVKIHPAITYTYGGDENYRPVWEFAARNELPIMSHTWDISSYNPKQKYAFPDTFEKYLKEYPSVPFIMAHAGGRYHGVLAAIKIGKIYPNVFYDIAGDIYANGFLERLVGEIGASRVFYGSDCSMMDQRTMLGVVIGADISLNDKTKILYKNANEFFNFGLQ